MPGRLFGDPESRLGYDKFGLIPGEEAYKNFNGWFAEYIKINAGGVVFNVSDMDVELRTLIEPAAVTIHAVEKAKEIFNFKHNSYVLVQGCGPIGLLLLTVVRNMGVRNIIAVDGDEKRLAMAEKLGAAYTVNFMKEDDHLFMRCKLSERKHDQGISLSFSLDHADQIINCRAEETKGCGKSGAGCSPAPDYDKNIIKNYIDGISQGQSDGTFFNKTNGTEQMHRSVGDNDKWRAEENVFQIIAGVAQIFRIRAGQPCDRFYEKDTGDQDDNTG